MLKVTTIQKENSLQTLVHCLLKKRAIIQVSLLTKAIVSSLLTEPSSIVVTHDLTKFETERN